ncbi:MAG: DUF86 domain-containing protein [Methanomicrobiales archaeon HGW-Methanomicrobiales-3]|jgi:uncharacterized protein with HEPN domain|nr:MAG: DUF86 domain-containing protein [Methanomicrobiales archaeon HGW-Methanomicrobiales-3]
MTSPREKRSAEEYLSDIRDAIHSAREFSKGVTFEEFQNNREKQFAIIHALEIIGEAAKQVPVSVRDEYPDIPWRDIAGMRDRLIHGYFSVNLERLWNTVLEDLPRLEAALKK